ncbi:hypothetical protein P8452_12166 [Trifolium repens]|nr:hypothetical protein P8452_12166 [Trifolium repens]
MIDFFRFPAENVTYISDEHREDTPTDIEILDELCKLVKGAQSRDILLFAYAGHGGSYECIHNNNSARVECLMAGERDDGRVRPITDDTIREIVETVPLDASFTMLSESCNSGGLIEGAYEQKGYSTIKFVNDRGKAPCNKYLQRGQLLNMPSGRGLGILISACQNYETATHLLRANGGSGTCFLTVIKVKGVHMSNLKLYKELDILLRKAKRADRSTDASTSTE